MRKNYDTLYYLTAQIYQLLIFTLDFLIQKEFV